MLADEGRDAISADLNFFKHPIDCRRKDKGQEKREKWFTGERFVSLCNGSRGSPGGPKLFARVLLTLADELLAGASATRQQQPAPAPPRPAAPTATQQRGRGALASGFQGFGARPGAPAPARAPKPTAAPQPELETEESLRQAARAKTDEGRKARLRLHARVTSAATRSVPQMERDADASDLELVRQHYGAVAQIIINNILAIDAYLLLYWLWKNEKSKFRDTHPNKLRFALANCKAAINYQEMLERVTIAAHKSWYPHLFVLKISLHILMYGDITALSISSLELLNALLKRAAKSNSPCRIELSEEAAQQRKEAAEREAASDDEEEEPAERVTLQRRAYSTTMSHQVATYVTAQQMLRKDESAIRHRRAERLFGENGSGRSSLVKKQKTEVAAAVAAQEEEQARVLARFVQSHGRWDDTKVEPHHDTCLKAVVRALKLRAEAAAA